MHSLAGARRREGRTNGGRCGVHGVNAKLNVLLTNPRTRNNKKAMGQLPTTKRRADHRFPREGCRHPGPPHDPAGGLPPPGGLVRSPRRAVSG